MEGKEKGPAPFRKFLDPPMGRKEEVKGRNREE